MKPLIGFCGAFSVRALVSPPRCCCLRAHSCQAAIWDFVKFPLLDMSLNSYQLLKRIARAPTYCDAKVESSAREVANTPAEPASVHRPPMAGTHPLV